MSDINALVMDIVMTSGFALRLGMMIAVAIILGFVLYDDYHEWWKWFLLGAIYIIFQEWLRLTVITDIATKRPAILSTACSILYGIAILVGMYLSKRAKKIIFKRESHADDILYRILNNSHSKSSIVDDNKDDT